MRSLATAAALLCAACGAEADAPRSPAGPPADQVGAVDLEARRLASEVRELADRIADYAGSHRNRAPKRLRDLAVDSLTPETARTITVTDSTRVTVAFRRPAGRALLACTGGPAVLEEAQLNSGLFHLACRTPAGDTTIAAQELP